MLFHIERPLIIPKCTFLLFAILIISLVGKLPSHKSRCIVLIPEFIKESRNPEYEPKYPLSLMSMFAESINFSKALKWDSLTK